jgi:lipopolysaccharide/colanic/teichoic acid biosynthesis glycosyltransferase
VDEIIFCSKDLPANSIIEWMTQIDNSVVDFKIVPEETNFIIGSNSKNRRGDFYQLQINLNIIDERNIKYKRLLDIATSILFIILFPIFALVIEKPTHFLRNIFNVLTGKKSWVGFTHANQVNLPKIKTGIIHPSIAMENMNDVSIQEANFIYARDYHLFMDVSLIAKSLKYLGRS